VTEWLMSPAYGQKLPSLADWLRRPAWHQDAACRGQDTGAWFSGAQPNLERAGAVCSACTVSPECRAYALGDDTLEGVWAGLTKAERRELRRRGRVA
jgi:WhiB family transcriptional regulator, redox-sensing transcriptional regulator